MKEEEAHSIPFLKCCITALHSYYKFRTGNLLYINLDSNKEHNSPPQNIFARLEQTDTMNLLWY